MRWLRLYHLCEKFKTLPRPGAIAQQERRTMEYFFLIMSCFAEKQDQPKKMAELSSIASKVKRGKL